MRISHHTVLSTSLSLLLFEGGCGPRATPLLAESLRASLGEVVVVSAEAAPDWHFSRPVPGGVGASAVGVGVGLGAGVLGGAACFATYGILWTACAAALWTPVMMVTGAVEGAVKGVSIADLREASEALELTAGESIVQDELRDELVRIIIQQGGDRVVTARLDRGPATLTARADYRALADEGVNSVIEVAVLSLDLERERASLSGKVPSYGPSFSIQRLIDPPLILRVHARARLVRVGDGTELYAHTFVRESATRSYLEWGRDNARALREARHDTVEAIAREMVTALIGWKVKESAGD